MYEWFYRFPSAAIDHDMAKYLVEYIKGSSGIEQLLRAIDLEARE